MFKSLEELRKMTTEEIKQYIKEIEQHGESVEYADWCGDVLDAALTEKGIDIMELFK